jgi:hypothetical protein
MERSVRNITKTSNMPKQNGPQLSYCEYPPYVENVKFENEATVSPSKVHSPIVFTNPTNEKMSTRAR